MSGSTPPWTGTRPMEHGPAVVHGSVIHRVEHAFLAVALAGVVWWLVQVQGVTDWWRVAFWAIAPDLVFIPIAVTAARHHGQWPPWASQLYNSTHTYVVMLPSLALASLLQGHVVWPLLAWAFHIEADRALGFDLRAWT